MKIRAYTKIGRQEGILGWDCERLTIRVDAPPVDGAANARLVEILSAWLGIANSDIEIVKGHTSRYKIIEADVDIVSFNLIVNKLPRLSQQQKIF